MKVLEISNYIKEENTRYTEGWGPLQLWKMAVKTVISRLEPKNLFQKVLKDVLLIKEL